MATLINFGLIQLTRNEASQLSQSLWQQRMVKNNFQEKELSHKCSTLAVVKTFLLLLSINDLTSGELKARNSAFLFDEKNIRV